MVAPDGFRSSKSLSSSNNGWGANNKRGRVPSPPVTKTPLLWMAVTPENVINGIKRIVSNGPFCPPIDTPSLKYVSERLRRRSRCVNAD